jgi:hypothetical protein
MRRLDNPMGMRLIASVLSYILLVAGLPDDATYSAGSAKGSGK